jgi:carboxyl-terminal processing protease
MTTTPGRRILAALGLAATLAACGGDDPEKVSGACTTSAENAALLATANDWYLYQDLVPTSTSYQQLVSTTFAPASSYASPQALLDAFTAAARAKNEDRYWSYLLTQQEANQYFQAGQSAGYGIGLLITGSTGSERLFITQVMRGSPADLAGFVRGDEVLALGSTEQGMVAIPTLVDGNLFAVTISGATPGTVKYFSVVPRGATAAVTRSMTSADYDLDPVVASTVASPGGKPVGYVLLRTFVTTAEDRLRTAFAAFKQQGIRDVVVDVRYDGGGLLDTAKVLASLLHPTAGELMYTGNFNDRHKDQNWRESFAGEANRLAAVDRVAFITTSGTASASELVPNALAPYLGVNLAIVGDRTYGKPVGQATYNFGSSCQDELFLISFQLQNKAGFGGYYDGLPDAAGQFGGSSCAASDDLTHDTWDPAESSTAQALAFIDGGQASCTPVATSTATATASHLAAARGAAYHPRPEHPSPAQLEMPGLF